MSRARRAAPSPLWRLRITSFRFQPSLACPAAQRRIPALADPSFIPVQMDAARSSDDGFPGFLPKHISEPDIVLYTEKSHKTTPDYCLSGSASLLVRTERMFQVVYAGASMIADIAITEGDCHV